MATRQYIGARYVPKFYQNSVDGSTQWESNVVYEPLMYVTLTNGHMYISKKQVPATVGSPVNNIDYWLDIGSYNGFIEQLQNEIDDINNVTIPAIQSDVANKQDSTDNNLNTTNKTVVGAINEVNTAVQGAVTTLADKQNKTDNNLTTTDKTVVGGINELDTELQTLNNKVVNIIDPYEKFRNKTICVIGDSISAYTTLANNWVKLLTDFMADYDCTVINKAIDGDSFAGLAGKITGGTYTVDSADYYIVFLGTNYDDSWGYTTGTYPLAPAITTVCNAIRNAANVDAKYFFVSPLKKFMSNVNSLLNPLSVMRNVLELLMGYQGYTVISGYNIGELSAATTSRYMTDLLHPTEAFSPILFKYILDGLVSERSNITQPAAEGRTFSNTLSSSSNVFIKYNGLHIVIKIDVNGFSPSTGEWVDICDVPTLIDDQPFPFVQMGAIAGNTYQYRISGGKLQAYFFTAPTSTFKDIVDFYITAQQRC